MIDKTLTFRQVDSSVLFDRSGQGLPSQSRSTQDIADETNLEAKLYANRSALKVMTSQISMHLRPDQRGDFFAQVDELLDTENWTEDDGIISLPSYRTFLRFVTYYKDTKRPALTVSSHGNISASWFQEGRRLTIEFFERDIIRIFLYRNEPKQSFSETAAYHGPLTRLDAVLQPYQAVSWYRNGTT